MRPDEEAAAEKARFCLATGIAPTEYDALTDVEREAFVEEANDRARRSRPGLT